MAHQRYGFLLKRALIIGILACVVPTLAGCGYLGYYVRKAHWQTTFENIPSMSALNKLAPEDSLILGGRIIRLQQRQEPLLLAAISNRYQQNEKVSLVQLQVSVDVYMAFLPKGDYELFVFADLNRNGDFERDELVGRTSVSVNLEHSKDGAVVEGPAITADFAHPGEADFRVREEVRPTGYVYASLDDDFFDPRFGDMGLYNPTELIAHTQGFIFGLESYDEEKTTVLFIHGISGTPRDWKFIVDGLDRDRFQPFFFYYPSGLRLDKLGAVLAQTIDLMNRRTKNGHPRIVLVAHSMGGLVALSAINKLSAGFPSSLKMYCSFSTPYAGDETARKWIDNAPLVVPVWRDIVAQSEFLQDLALKPFPKKLPFHLYFTYGDPSILKQGKNGDGSVSLSSQLAPSLQTAAVKVIGFNETHIGILNNEEARKSFLRLLDDFAP